MANFFKLLKQGLYFPKNFLQGRLRKPTINISDLKAGEGAIVEVKGEKVAVYKNDQGELVTLSPVCRHLGCIVQWNDREKTWDCPCHGSRYSAAGKVIHGPANKDLNKAKV